MVGRSPRRNHRRSRHPPGNRHLGLPVPRTTQSRSADGRGAVAKIKCPPVWSGHSCPLPLPLILILIFFEPKHAPGCPILCAFCAQGWEPLNHTPWASGRSHCSRATRCCPPCFINCHPGRSEGPARCPDSCSSAPSPAKSARFRPHHSTGGAPSFARSMRKGGNHGTVPLGILTPVGAARAK